MSSLLLIRHGQASFGAKNYDQLSMPGERRAGVTGHHLADVGQNLDVTVSGELSRRRRTAELAGAACDDLSANIIESAFDEYDSRALFNAYLSRVLDENPVLPVKRETLFDDRRPFKPTFECLTLHWIAGTPHELANFKTWADFTSRVGAGLVGFNNITHLRLTDDESLVTLR